MTDTNTAAVAELEGEIRDLANQVLLAEDDRQRVRLQLTLAARRSALRELRRRRRRTA